MAFARFDSKNASAPMAEINMVPLIDVLLVLLVIFIVCAPLLTQAVRLELPKAGAPVLQQRIEKIDVSIDAVGTLHWNGAVVSRAEAAQRFGLEGERLPPPEVHLRADEAVPYRVVAQTLAAAAHAGLSKVGFVSAPQVAP